MPLKGLNLDLWFKQCQNPACQLRFPSIWSSTRAVSVRFAALSLSRAEKVPLTRARLKTPQQRPVCTGSFADNIRSALNVGAIFRAADGVVYAVWLGGITPVPTSPGANRENALGAEQAVPWESAPNALTLAADLKAQGYTLLALENAPYSRPLFSYRPESSGQNPMLLIVGSEQAGVDPGLLALANETLCLPMSGSKGSLNVAVAFGIAAYWLRFAPPL